MDVLLAVAVLVSVRLCDRYAFLMKLIRQVPYFLFIYCKLYDIQVGILRCIQQYLLSK